MAEFLTTFGTSNSIEQIIMGAKKKLVLVSPYLQLSKNLFQRLVDADNKNVNISIIYGKDELKPNEKNSLTGLNNLKLFYFEDLHAKCYFNESEMVITSMNMYEYSERNNREMGVLIKKSIDFNLFESAVNEAYSILQSSEEIPLFRTERKYYQSEKKNKVDDRRRTKGPGRAYCIRCETRIPFNPEKPFCWDCFTIWSQYEQPEFQENFCHSCGEYERSSMAKPLCYSCYKRLSN